MSGCGRVLKGDRKIKKAERAGPAFSNIFPPHAGENLHRRGAEDAEKKSFLRMREKTFTAEAQRTRRKIFSPHAGENHHCRIDYGLRLMRFTRSSA